MPQAQFPGLTTRRRALATLGAAATGASVAALANAGSAQAATSVGDVFIDARSYGVVGDGSTDNHSFLAAFVTAVASAGPGATGVLPPGVILTSAPLAFGARSGINIMGNGRMATVLRKTANIDLVQMNGSGPGAANHCSQCSLSHLTLDGNSSQYIGRLLDCAYADNLLVHAVQLQSNNDIGIDTTETWDSHFDDIVCDGVNSRTAPCIFIRSSRATSGFGQSSDTTNVIRLTNIRCESWRYGALKIDLGAGGSGNPNQIWIDRFKAETYYAGYGPAIVVGAANVVHISHFYVFVGGFDSGQSTAIDAISCTGLGVAGSLRDGHVGNEANATINHGVFAYVGTPLVIDNLDGAYGSAPTSGDHIFLAGGGPYYLGHNPANNIPSEVAFAPNVRALSWPYNTTRLSGF